MNTPLESSEGKINRNKRLVDSRATSEGVGVTTPKVGCLVEGGTDSCGSSSSSLDATPGGVVLLGGGGDGPHNAG